MKPKLSKSDKGIFRRLKIIDYPNEFVENPDPKKPNQKKIDVNLKTKLSHQDYINEFMLMLLETAKEGKIDEPQQIKDAVNEYKEDNDPIKGWLLENFELLREDLPLKERIKTSELYNEFPEKLNLTASSFKQYLIMNEVKVKICSGINYAFNLKRKPQQEEQNDLDN
jgi:phage/plasmid-associated DNA primase